MPTAAAARTSCGSRATRCSDRGLTRGIAMRAAVVVLLAAVTAAFAPQQTFRTSVDLVHFSVIVTDKQGAPVTGLTADDFELVEDGKSQTISYFLEGFPESGDLGRVLPLHLGLALDTSGSMEDDI